MLKPIEALQIIGKAKRMDKSEIRRKQGKLLDILLHPTRTEHGETVVEVFAHGVEAMRLAAVKCDGDRFPHWAVQSWSVTKEDWITQKSYDMKMEMRNTAYLDAKNWYPISDQANVIKKWEAVNSINAGFEHLFDSRAKLAEFWYETKVIDRKNLDVYSFPFMVAETAFALEGRPHPLLDAKSAQKIQMQLAKLASNWGELDLPVVGHDYLVATYGGQWSGLKQWHDTTLRHHRYATDVNNEIFYFAKRDGTGTLAVTRGELAERVSGFEYLIKERNITMKNKQEESFIITINYEKWTNEDKDIGEPGERGIELEQELVDADELVRYGRDYGISEPSSTDPRIAPNIWFNSTSPIEDREHYEHGIDKYYSLHILEVNGREPEPEDYQKVANLIGIKFDNPIELAGNVEKKPIYGYYINLDERGDFYADVRDTDGKTLYEIHAGESLPEDESSIFDDGLMRHKNDLGGLTKHLREIGVIPKDGDVLSMHEFEEHLEGQEYDELSFG